MSQSKLSHVALAQPSDIAALEPLFQALYAHETPNAAAPDDATCARHIKRLLDEETPHDLIIAWGTDGRSLGLVAVARVTSISDPRPDNWTQIDLKELFVLPEARGQNIGRALMEWVQAYANRTGACRIDWHVKSDNADGIRFYERFGAKVVHGRLSMRKML
ncbi:GNAT family N-acetyltransferase [Cognatishimia sp. D5M38]|uniref:GNAT family N-acetyltransferase n=1 Tax=Cognatishimia coralii TaxID=3083254 RepID=A0ABU8QE92_9RHOB